MAKQIARLLKTDIMADLDMPALAQVLASKGRKGDTMLAHITPQEAALLKARGGAGTMNPDTGLPEFYAGSYTDFDAPDYTTGRYRTRAEQTFSGSAPDIEQIGSYREATRPLDYESLQNKAATQYAPTAGTSLYPRIAYQPVSPGDVYEGSPYGASVEFPSEMSARSSLLGATPAATVSGEQNYGDINRSLGFSPTGVYDGNRLTSAYALPNPVASSLALELQRPDYAPTASELAPQQPSFLRRTADYLQRPETLERLGLAGLQALPGILQAREARKQGQRAKEEMQRLGAPYQQQGQALIQQAQRGELTAPAQQQIQALQARAAQGVAGRGGVGAEQSAAQVEAFRQQLLQGQYDMGLKVANIGDQIAAGAIRTGLTADQYVNELTNNYFSNMARTLYGTPQTAQTNPPR